MVVSTEARTDEFSPTQRAFLRHMLKECCSRAGEVLLHRRTRTCADPFIMTNIDCRRNYYLIFKGEWWTIQYWRFHNHVLSGQTVCQTVMRI